MLQPPPSLDPSARQLTRARTLFLDAIRKVRALDPGRVAQPFLVADDVLLPGFRGVLARREADRSAPDALADLVVHFDPDINRRLALLAQTLPDHRFFTIRGLIAARGFRRAHSAVLGSAALMMWGLLGEDSERHWRHGMAAGVLSMLALRDDPVESDRAFAAGLLHDLGSLALEQAYVPRWSGESTEPLVAEAAGKLVMAALELPGWLHQAIVPCALPVSDSRGPLHRVLKASCRLADELGYRGGSRMLSREDRPAAIEPGVARLRRVLEDQGGGAWLEERLEAMTRAARGDLPAALWAA